MYTMIGNVSLNPPRQYPRIAWERVRRHVIILAVCSTMLSFAQAQYPPSVFSDAGITTLNSPVDGNITISYKSPPVGTCTTVFSSQKQYTGYVTVPPFTLSPIQQNYTVNTFFWFIEARMSPETAPLTIYLNGGPGSSSMIGLFQEVGPCEVVEIAEGLLGTEARDWGWDRSSHVLFVDQPDQVGFSYDVLINASIDLLTSAIIEPPIALPASQHAYSFLNGTFPSGDSNNTANTTAIAAQTVWHMLQGFLGAFPQYNPGLVSNSTNAAVGINLFVESYGGKYGSAFASFWQSQNLLREQGLLSKNTTLQIDLVSLGIINGCIDDLVQGPFYPKFAYSNTYSIQALSLVDEQTAANAFLATNGCQQLIKSCRSQADSSDTDNKGDVANVNAICYQATATCASEVINVYAQSGRSYYDISQATLNPFPPNSFIEYLNQANVQSAIGVPVNFTTTSTAVTGAFNATGDYERGDYIESLAWLLSQGIRVALIYGDRDYVCNWLGGEAVSFAVAGAIQSDYSQWYNAGYAPIIVNDSYIGGVVREYGNLSFSRIYDAGHLVPAYQPETAFTVFTRVIEGTDISTGETVNLTSYYSQGDANATHTNSAPAMASPTCYLRAIDSTCSTAQKSALTNGEGVVINGIWYDKASDWTAPDSSVSEEAGVPGTAASDALASVPSSTTSTQTGISSDGPSSETTSSTSTGTTSDLPTGVYIATATPTTSSHSLGSQHQRSNHWLGYASLVILFGSC